MKRQRMKINSDAVEGKGYRIGKTHRSLQLHDGGIAICSDYRYGIEGKWTLEDAMSLTAALVAFFADAAPQRPLPKVIVEHWRLGAAVRAAQNAAKTCQDALRQLRAAKENQCPTT